MEELIRRFLQQFERACKQCDSIVIVIFYFYRCTVHFEDSLIIPEDDM
jgi:hypothetical protein